MDGSGGGKQVSLNTIKKIKTKPYPRYKPSGIDWLGDVPELE
jgi:hypothetical protein